MPEDFGTGRKMPNLDITEEEARGIVAFLKWMSSIDTNGFPRNFTPIKLRRVTNERPGLWILRNLTGGQKLAVKYFVVAVILFAAQSCSD